MLKFMFGMVCGGLIVYLFLQYPDPSFKANVSVNIVIAIATCFAAGIHFDSIRKQKKDRTWDINKSILLELVYLLSEEIDFIEDTIDCAYDNRESVREPKNDSSGTLDEKINNALNVYKPLLGKDLTEGLSKYKSTNIQIRSELFDDENDLDTLEAYEQSLASCKELHKKLIKFIEKFSGISK